MSSLHLSQLGTIMLHDKSICTFWKFGLNIDIKQKETVIRRDWIITHDTNCIKMSCH